MNLKDVFSVGLKYYKEEKYLKAIEYFDKLLGFEPNSIESLYQKSQALFKLGDLGSSKLGYEKALNINPELPYIWDGLGNVYAASGQYDIALEHYEKALKLCFKDVTYHEFTAMVWTNIANSLRKLDELELALDACNKAIQIDENYALAWQSKGHILSSRELYKMADTAYDKSIGFDEKNRFSWLGKGNIRFLLLIKNRQSLSSINEIKFNNFDYNSINDNARIFFNRALFYNLNTYEGLQSIFSFYQIFAKAPFLTYRLFSDVRYLKARFEYKNLFEQTVNSCNPLLIWVAYTYLQRIDSELKKGVNLADCDWIEWLGILNYYNGDPIASYYLFLDLLNRDEVSLRTYYYLILSCEDFQEDSSQYYYQAKKLVENLKSSRHNSTSRKMIREKYYAALIYFFFDENVDEILKLLDTIKDSFLPALYLYVEVLSEKNRKISNEIISLIRKNEKELCDNKQLNFTIFPDVNILSTNSNDWWTNFYHYFFYEEIQGGIKIYSTINTSSSNDFGQSAYELNPFWELWKMDEGERKKIFTFSDDYCFKILGNKLISERTKGINQQRLRLKISDSDIIRRLQFEGNIKLLSLYRELSKEETNVELDKSIARFIESKSLEDAKYYFLLIDALYIKGYLNERDKIILETYTIFHLPNSKDISRPSIEGLRDTFKLFI